MIFQMEGGIPIENWPMSQEAQFQIGMVGEHCYLVAHQPSSSDTTAFPLTLTSRAVANVLQVGP